MFAIFAAAAAASLEPFDFKGYTAGRQIDPSRIERCNPDDANDCSLKLDSEEIDGYRPLLVVVSSYKGRLSHVSIESDAIAFSKITDAFKAKYGQPCSRSSPSWRSRIGRPIPNPTYTWCFATGRLTAVMHGAVVDVSEYDYVDANRAPLVHSKPKIDF